MTMTSTSWNVDKLGDWYTQSDKMSRAMALTKLRMDAKYSALNKHLVMIAHERGVEPIVIRDAFRNVLKKGTYGHQPVSAKDAIEFVQTASMKVLMDWSLRNYPDDRELMEAVALFDLLED